MSKRKLEEGSAAAVAAAEISGSDAASKKRKTKHAEANGGEELTKAQRKELKKLKKAKSKHAADDIEMAEVADSVKDTTENSVQVPVDAEAEKAAAKAARKAEKKRLKAEKSGNAIDAEEQPVDDVAYAEIETSNADKKLSKEEKKARKEKKKALKTESTADAGGEPTDIADQKYSKKARREEKERLKAEREAQGKKSSKAASAFGANGHKAPSTVSVVKDNYAEDASLKRTSQAEVDDFLASNFISIEDPTTKETLRPIMAFSQLPSEAHPQPSPFAKFKSPTPIQAASWPFLLAGRDVVGVAETGSGKTLAFGVPCIRHIKSLPKARGGAARAVIVSPTRELAVQIHEQIVTIAKPAGLQAVCVYGGVPKESQRAELKTAQIVVATPGRLNDLVEEGTARLENVNYMVLDEADRMLDKGFEDAIRKIVSAASPDSSTPSSPTRQTLMFTATWPQSIRELAATFMRNPVKIAIGDNPTGELRANTRIKQTVEVVDPRGKEQRLFELIKQYQSGKQKDDRILVFCLYKKEATRVEETLRRKGFRVAGIHGDLSQEKRAASLESFKLGRTPLLVATDVAARGLDIPAVKVVINVTFPLTVEDYVHRIGRTGRAGADGIAITLFTEHDKAQSGALINVLRAANQPIPDDLMKFGTTVKKKGHEAYGAFFKDNADGKEATKIKFDD